MLTNIFIPKWLRGLIVLMILSQVGSNSVQLIERVLVTWKPSIKEEKVLTHYKAIAAWCTEYSQAINDRAAYQELEERLADEREARQE